MTHKSHFVPYQIVNALDGQRPGPDYSDATNKEIEKILDSSENTSETTAAWNQGMNRTFENQITSYATGKSEWSDLSDGAKDRYYEQAEAWKDIRDDMKEVAPGLTKELDHLYNKGNKK
jgi:hypothetical protein